MTKVKPIEHLIQPTTAQENEANALAFERKAEETADPEEAAYCRAAAAAIRFGSKNARFLRNVREAREFGYDLVCSECGAGIYDADSDEHDQPCSKDPEGLAKWNALVESWTARQAAKRERS